MAHVRKQIRDAVVTAVTGLTTTGASVFQSRDQTLDESKLPALLIYTIEESSEPITQKRPRTIARQMNVAIEIAAQATAALDDTLDQIAAEIEVAMAADVTLGGLAKTSVLGATEIEFSEEGKKPIAGARLTYAVVYHTAQNDPETAL